MADVPKSLLDQIKEFEDVFTVDKQKLKEIVAHFVKELEKGMCTFTCFGNRRSSHE
jgi:hexokinase